MFTLKKGLRGIEITPTDEIFNLFQSPEGFNSVYYGKVRNGKTRTATADILELLKRGEVVIANWKVDFQGYDERNSFWIVFLRTLFGKKNYFVYDPKNFHFVEPIDLIKGVGTMPLSKLKEMVGVHIYIDEGQWVLPSMDKSFDKDNLDRMELVLHGGHYCRSLNIITQRPQNISKNTRSQIHMWYRCVKRFDIGNLMLFQRWEIQDMKDDMPLDFDSEGKPLGIPKTYWVNKKHDPVFKAYNTHAMRGKEAVEKNTVFKVFSLNRKEGLKLLIERLTGVSLK